MNAETDLIVKPSLFTGSNGILVKVGLIGFLILLLLIPLAFVGSLLRERLMHRDLAVSEVQHSWGGPQNLIGPILQVPYEVKTLVWRDQVVGGNSSRIQVEESSRHLLWILPKDLIINAELVPQRLQRGIFPVVVYDGKIHAEGHFTPPPWEDLGIDPDRVNWDQTIIAWGLSDPRGIKGPLSMHLDNYSLALLPSPRLSILETGVHAPLPSLPPGWTTLPFAFDLQLRGSRTLQFAPLGEQTKVSITSTWPDPGFHGGFLPVEREVSNAGFRALWEIAYFARNFPQSFTSSQSIGRSELQTALAGVTLVQSIDSYRSVERATKHGILVLVFVFAGFFLFEVIGRLRIHPFQYLLVGLALSLFYLLLLALSEFLGFGLAYMISAGATWLLLTLYSWAVLQSGAKSVVIGALMAAIYGFLYLVLQLQDHALLVGSAALFSALAIVMYLTRKMDWYGLAKGA